MPQPPSETARASPLIDASALCSCQTTSMFTPAGMITVVRVLGEIDLSTDHVLHAALSQARRRRPSHLVIDVAGMGFCSVHGLALLIHAGAEPGGHPAEYLLSGIKPHLERYLDLLGSTDTLPVRYPSVGSAVLAAMAHQRERRSHERPAGHAVGHPARPRLSEATDLDRVRQSADDELTERARNGDGDAYREPAYQHRARMYSRALQMLGSPENPEDTAHDIAGRLRMAVATFSQANPP